MTDRAKKKSHDVAASRLFCVGTITKPPFLFNKNIMGRKAIKI